MTRVALAFAVSLLLTTTALAEPAPLSAASATRLADGQVELKVTYDGGACETPGEAAVTSAESDETLDSVTIPTTSTAEVCTMQIVPVAYEGVIAVEALTTTLAITVLSPEGQIKAAGSVDILKAGAAP